MAAAHLGGAAHGVALDGPGPAALRLGAVAFRAHLLLHHDARPGALRLEPRRPAARRLSADHAAAGGASVERPGAAAARPVVLAAGADHPVRARDGALPGLPALPADIDPALLPAAAGGPGDPGGLHPHPGPDPRQARALRRRGRRAVRRLPGAAAVPALRRRT